MLQMICAIEAEQSTFQFPHWSSKDCNESKKLFKLHNFTLFYSKLLHWLDLSKDSRYQDYKIVVKHCTYMHWSWFISNQESAIKYCITLAYWPISSQLCIFWLSACVVHVIFANLWQSPNCRNPINYMHHLIHHECVHLMHKSYSFRGEMSYISQDGQSNIELYHTWLSRMLRCNMMIH